MKTENEPTDPFLTDNEPTDPFLPDNFSVTDHCYHLKQLEPLVENTIVYVSGYVVRKIIKKIQCTSCRLLLVANGESALYKNCFVLLKTKQMGGLVCPSDFTITVLMSAERHLRRISNVHNVICNVSVLRLQSNVMAEVGVNDLLGFNGVHEHMLETVNGINNHVFSIIRELVAIFFKIRQYHTVKMQNIKLKGCNIRQKMTKTILFKGQ
jgi:hypothetical protein